MVRAPCCEKMGLKKGPWTPEEDQILVSYIKIYGHGNWRALPKQAGLLRCGKSCRLRWTNYLRPDIKRGNFTREEEDTIIRLHEMLGNRWSAIAARLPGRTDNEIKNVWHTHLKKRLKQNHHSRKQEEEEQQMTPVNQVMIRSSESTDNNPLYRPILPSSPQQECSSDMSSFDTDNNNSKIHNHSHITNTCMKQKAAAASENFVEIDDNFWSEVLSAHNSSIENDFSAVGADPLANEMELSSTVNDFSWNNNLYESMDYWYNLFTRAGESLELPEI